MTILQTLPYTPDELAVLKEKRSDVAIETIVLSFGLIFLLGLLSIMITIEFAHFTQTIFMVKMPY